MNLKKTIRNLAFFVSLASSVYAQQKIIPSLSNALILTDKEQNSLKEGNHIVVNIPSFRLYFCKDNEIVKEYPISVGRIGIQTPEGHFNVNYKVKNPGYIPVEGSIYKKVADYFPPGKNNPMGTRVVHFFGHLYIHGLSEEKRDLIGKMKGGRCVGLLREDIEELFPYVSTGTPVDIYYKTTLIKNKNSKLSFKQFKDAYRGYRLILGKNDSIERIHKKIKKKAVHFADTTALSGKNPKKWALEDNLLDDIIAITDE